MLKFCKKIANNLFCIVYFVYIYTIKSKTNIMNYTLKVTETNKAGKFLYQVIDENGTIISEKKSTRVYVACTRSGGYTFGRLDLIGKGEHGQAIRHYTERLSFTKYPYKQLIEGLNEEESLKRFIENAKESLIALNSIAYIK